MKVARMSSSRLIATILALGGIIWSVLLLSTFGLWSLLPLPFGVGYLLTIGYCIRSVANPSMTFRSVLWWGSIVINGVFLAVDLFGNGSQAFEKPVPLIWWSFAVSMSSIALVCERK